MRKIYRFLFSRYSVSAAAMLCQLLVTVAVLLYASHSFAPFYALCLVMEILTAIAVINDDMNPEYKIPWLVTVISLPIFGFFLYLVLHTRRMSRRESEQMKRSIEALQYANTYECKLSMLGEESLLASTKALAILRDDPLAKVYSDTACRYFSSGEQMFCDMLRDLRCAREFIFLEYFIIEQGYMWNEIHEVLRQKAEEGVEVRLLYDDIGCMTSLPKGYDRVLESEGIRCARFSRFSAHLSCVHNNRDHRKITVIDGDIAYTGGINLADEYVGRKMRCGHWKDGGVRLCGSGALGLCAIFLSGWEVAYGGGAQKHAAYLRARPVRGEPGYFIPFGSGPRPIYKRSVGKQVFLNIINQSQTFIYISTPYLIIDYDLTQALCGAARRGVDVRIITPRVPDKPLIKIMTKSSYPVLIEAGVRIYEYSPGFIHEKLLISDGSYAVVGTINLDYRSLVHHYENAVWIYGAPAVAEMLDSYLKTLSLSEEIGKHDARLGPREAIFKNIIRIFAPLL